MQIPKFKFFLKREPSINSLHKELFRAHFLWVIALAVFVVLSLLGALIGLLFFRSVYYESYKNESELQTEVTASVNINVLQNAIKARQDVLEKQVVIPADPSQ